MRWAKGTHSLGICDACGMQYPYRLLVPDGYNPKLRVHPSCRDEPHPAEKPVRLDEGIALKNPRPDRDDDSPGTAVDHSGTARAGSANSLTLATDASSVANDYINGTLALTGGAGSEQSQTIQGYNGSTKVATVSPRWRTNLLLRSEEFDNAAAWSTVNTITVTANAATAPDETATADKLTASAVVDPFIGQGFNYGSAIAGRTFTFSVWLWTDAGQPTSSVGLYLYNDGAAEIETAPVTVTTTPQRFSVTKTFSGGAAGNNLFPRIDLPQTGDGGSAGEYWYAWGAQLEEVSAVGDYIKTEAAAITLPDSTTEYTVTVPDTLAEAMGFTNTFGGGT